MNKQHRIVTKLVVILTPAQRKACLAYAANLGLNFDEPKPQVLLKRLFGYHGSEVVEKAMNYMDYAKANGD